MYKQKANCDRHNTLLTWALKKKKRVQNGKLYSCFLYLFPSSSKLGTCDHVLGFAKAVFKSKRHLIDTETTAII